MQVKVGSVTYRMDPELAAPFQTLVALDQERRRQGKKDDLPGPAGRLFQLLMGRKPGRHEVLDHLNGDARDFTRGNVVASHRQREAQRAREGRARQREGQVPAPMRGITELPGQGWRVRVIRIVDGERKRRQLGLYPTAEAAIRARDADEARAGEPRV